MPDKNSMWWRLVNLEPVLWKTIILTIVAVLGSVGILVNDDLANNLVILWTTLMSIIQLVWVRGSVTANARVAVLVPDPADPSAVAPGAAFTSAPSTEIVQAARTRVF
jgi:hypothetical protein